MAHTSTHQPLNAAESQFMEYMRRADDFFKISLLRQARSLYTKALGLGFETEHVEKQIAECNRLLAYETKVAYILTAIAAIAVAAALLF